SDSVEEYEDKGVFDNLDDLPELNFRSKRAQSAGDAAQETVTAESDESSETATAAPADDSAAPSAPRYSASEDDYDDGDYDDDDAPSPNLRAAPVTEDVLNVLRSEAAFSSASAARDKLDAATADAIDGDGEERKFAADRALSGNDDPNAEPDDSASDLEQPGAADFAEEVPRSNDDAGAPVQQSDDTAAEDAAAGEDTPDEDEDLGFAGLTEFLDAHAGDNNDDASDKDTLQPDPSAPEPEEATGTEAEDEGVDSGFDPLADLEAIRSQLETIGASRAAGAADQEPDTEPEGEEEQYTPILPSDDPLPDDTAEELRNPYAQDDSLDTEDDVTEDLSLAGLDAEESPSDMHGALRTGEEGEEDDDPDFDDMEEDRARHAYRADKDAPAAKTSDVEEDADAAETGDTPKGGVAAAAIMGLSRPKAKTGRGRARVKQGFGLEEDAESSDLSLLEKNAPVPADETESGQSRRKSLLPDVDELDASLRSDGGEPRRRDREMREAHEEELARSKSGGFRRAFVWTVFVFAILIALYLLHPLIVAGMPAAAVVLDPYASAIDSLRLLIERRIGG
ncbi:MAG: hypothetical protein GYB24_06105, partial [Rhodobacteraceae bacterium]|nr:hypothetical protein [Paracoccaceae bacterium]